MKIDKKFGIVVMFDIIFIIAFIMLMLLYIMAYNWSGNVFFNLPLSKITDTSQILQFKEAIFEAGKITNQFVFRMTASVLVLFILFVLSISLCKGISWSIVMKKKFTGKFFKKFLYLNFIWFGIWFLIFLIMFFITKTKAMQISFLIQLVLMLYFTPILYCGFDVKKKTRDMIKQAFSKGITKSSKVFFVFFKMYVVLLVFFVTALVVGIASKGFAAFYFVIMFLFWHSRTKYYLFKELK